MLRTRDAGLRAADSKSPATYFGRLAVEQVGSSAPWPLRVFEEMGEARRRLQGLAD